MAIADATSFPVKGQAFRTSGVITSSATSNPITAVLDTLRAQVSVDGGAFNTSASNPVQVSGNSGYWYVDLSPSEMNGNTVLLRVTAANAGAVEFAKEINPMDLSEPTGRYDTQTVVRFEQLFVQFYAVLLNYYNFAVGGTSTIYKKDSSTPMLSHTYSAGENGSNRGKAS